MDIYDPIAEALGLPPIDFIPDYSEYGVNYIALGGIPPWNKGMRGVVKHSEETKNKMGASRKGKTMTEAQKANLSAAKKGKSPSNKGKPMSEEQKEKIRAAKRRNDLLRATSCSEA